MLAIISWFRFSEYIKITTRTYHTHFAVGNHLIERSRFYFHLDITIVARYERLDDVISLMFTPLSRYYKDTTVFHAQV